MELFNANWQELFVPDESILEMFLRGTITYFFVISLLRIVPRRHSGSLSSSDFIFVLLLASSAHYSLTGGQTSITFGLGVILTIVFWNGLLNWLSYHFPKIKIILEPTPLSLIKNGQFLQGNMRKEFITKEELITELRKQGIRNVGRVKEAHIESDGKISFITYNKNILNK